MVVGDHDIGRAVQLRAAEVRAPEGASAGSGSRSSVRNPSSAPKLSRNPATGEANTATRVRVSLSGRASPCATAHAGSGTCVMSPAYDGRPPRAADRSGAGIADRRG
ncbi:hypothetical protein ACFQX6_15450 [Streptosporangium lutulentum]